MSQTLDQLTQRIVGFCEARDWAQFHNPKDLAISLNLEAAELLELMQWKDGAELDEKLASKQEQLGDELADVLYWTLLIAHTQHIDLTVEFERKMLQNEGKYPVERAKGSSAKYTEI